MQHGMRQYQQPIFNAAHPRENKIVAFSLCNRALGDADTAQERIGALYRNHQLWSVLIRDAAMEGNRLPAELKAQLAQLARWAMAYSVGAMAETRSLVPLITLNERMIEGLRGQQEAGPTVPPPITGQEFVAPQPV